MIETQIEDIFSGIRNLTLNIDQIEGFAKNSNIKEDFIYNQLIIYIVNSAGKTITWQEARELIEKYGRKIG